MLKFIKQSLSDIDGVSIYPIISLTIFFGVFITMLVIVIRMKKEKIEEISNLPLED